MVTQDQKLSTWKDTEDVVPKERIAMGKISQMEDYAVLRHCLLPAADELGVHLLRIAERSAAETDDVLVAKMGIGGEIHMMGVEFENLFGHNHLN